MSESSNVKNVAPVNAEDSESNSTIPRPSLGTELWEAWKNGAGMFCESYVVFAVGNVTNIWKILYSSCFPGKPIGELVPCNDQILSAIPFVEIAAIIFGMLLFGLLADHLGRLWGSRCTVALMLVGDIGITISFGVNLTGQLVMFTIFIILFSMGVGGEYPMASSTASERSEAHQLKRGRTVVLTFAMQGWGNFINTAIICILLLITQTGGCSSAYLNIMNDTLTGQCDASGLEVVWRVQYALALPVILWLFSMRFCVFKENEVWVKRQKSKYQLESPTELRARRWKHTKMLFGRKYISPLIGTCVGWFVCDIAFYGNKLFQGTIMNSIVGEASNVNLLLVMDYTLLNSFISLIGYYFAAFTIDYKWMGRVRMQIMGFTIIFIISIICGFDYVGVSSNSQLFLFLYLIQSFFMQCGPNSTTWLLPVELFPTDVRTQAHGMAASSGKLGALVASLIFSYANSGGAVSSSVIFIVSGFSCLVGALVTIIFVKDVTGVPLMHIDRRWSEDFNAAYGPSAAGTADKKVEESREAEDNTTNNNFQIEKV